MDNEKIRSFCLAMPHVTETLNWDHILVYWVGPREMGGKMFALTDADQTGACCLCFPAGEEHFYELLEREGVCPAPHMARAHWVGLERWNALRPREIEEELREAHARIFLKLTRRTRAFLELPPAEQSRQLEAKRAELAAEGRVSPLSRPKNSPKRAKKS